MQLNLLRSGDKKFIESVYKECYPSISNWVKKNSGTERESEDVFQDALVAVYQKSKDPDFQLNCKLSTYIFSVAKKIWLYKLRTRKRYVFTDFTASEELSPQDEIALDKLVIDAETDAVYKRNFLKLEQKCKEILAHFFNGLSMKEIVEKMAFTSETVARKRKFNCKNELVRLVKSDPHYIELAEKG